MEQLFRMQDQLDALTALAEDTVERLEHVAQLRNREGRGLSIGRRMKLVRLRDLLSRIDELIWRPTDDRKNYKQNFSSAAREL